MTWKYDRRRDVMTGHDHPGVCGNGMHTFTLDELEVGARAAMALDPVEEQAWWEIEALRWREQPGTHPDYQWDKQEQAAIAASEQGDDDHG